MKKGSKRACRCSMCERPRILNAWLLGLQWRLVVEVEFANGVHPVTWPVGRVPS